jgi:hypothetical protein
MNELALVVLDQVPWTVVVPVTAGLAAGGVALVLSKFVFAGAPKDPTLGKPDDKLTPEYDPFVQGSKSEQRTAFRRGGNPVEVLVTPGATDGPAARAWVVDRSMGGVCLSALDAVAQGTVLKMRALNAPPATPWVEVEVKSCRQAKDGWELGCQFIKTPPWAVMLLFG